MIEKYVVAAVSAALFGLFVFLAIRAWRRRASGQEALYEAPAPELQLKGEPTFTGSALYLASTVTDEPLNRITGHGLGFRSRVAISVYPEGVEIDGAGLRFAIERSQIASCLAGSVVIDRAVEEKGLVLLRWSAGSEIDSYFRFGSAAEQKDFMDRVNRLEVGHKA